MTLPASAISCLQSLRCIVCHAAYPPGDMLTCPTCGPVDGILDAVYDYDLAAGAMNRQTLAHRARDHWRYRELLPVAIGQAVPSLQLGWTPIYDSAPLAKHVGVRKLLLKDDGRNPTSSFKDRASSVGVMKAVEFGYKTITCASTGNAASSLAGFAAATGLRSFILVPERAPEPKVAQLMVFGANVIRVRGTYDQAYDLCMQVAARHGWYNRNCAVNPYLVEGKKTAGLEIAEQTGEDVPEWVAVSVGDGCTIAGIWKGLREMHRMGVIPRLPRMLAVQAEGSPAVTRQFEAAGEPPLASCGAATVADSICVAVPRNWRKAVRAVRESAGTCITVPDEDILEALLYTPKLTGVFGEPAAVTAVAGIRAARERRIIAPTDTVLAVVTGNGLKDIRTAMQTVGQPHSVEPDIREFENTVLPMLEE